MLETVTSNVAVRVPQERAAAMGAPTEAEWVWVTPGSPALLPGTVRAELLDSGFIVEGRVRVEDWLQAKAEGWKVVGFNGLR